MLQSCTAILSGYLGSAKNGRIIAEIVDRIKAINKRALFLCDPVMGDNGQPYVEKDILTFFKEKIAASADILTPNNYEASILIGEPVDTKQKALKALSTLRAKGIKVAIITGIETNRSIQTVARDEIGTWSVSTPKIQVASSGAGDLLARCFWQNILMGIQLHTHFPTQHQRFMAFSVSRRTFCARFANRRHKSSYCLRKHTFRPRPLPE